MEVVRGIWEAERQHDAEAVQPANEAPVGAAVFVLQSGIRLVDAKGAYRNRTGVNGFAGRCVATPPRRREAV